MWIVEQIKLRKKLLKISRTVLNDYRTKVKGNYHTPKLEARKKITRNVKYAIIKDTWYEKDGRLIYHFGNLTIVVESGVVTLIHNEKGKKGNFKKDKKLYNELNKELQIKES